MKKLIFSLLAVVAVLGCTKEKEGAVSECIQERLKTFDQSEACVNAYVSRYEFQGQTVYTFDRGDCGIMDSIEVRNEECTLLGYLGGYTNSSNIINNVSFYSSAQYTSIIWSKH